MGKKTKLELSNFAHQRLALKHSLEYEKTENGENWIRNGYHNAVLKEQMAKKAVLDLERKKAIYRNCEYFYYN